MPRNLITLPEMTDTLQRHIHRPYLCTNDYMKYFEKTKYEAISIETIIKQHSLFDLLEPASGDWQRLTNWSETLRLREFKPRNELNMAIKFPDYSQRNISGLARGSKYKQIVRTEQDNCVQHFHLRFQNMSKEDVFAVKIWQLGSTFLNLTSEKHAEHAASLRPMPPTTQSTFVVFDPPHAEFAPREYDVTIVGPCPTRGAKALPPMTCTVDQVRYDSHNNAVVLMKVRTVKTTFDLPAAKFQEKHRTELRLARQIWQFAVQSMTYDSASTWARKMGVDINKLLHPILQQQLHTARNAGDKDIKWTTLCHVFGAIVPLAQKLSTATVVSVNRYVCVSAYAATFRQERGWKSHTVRNELYYDDVVEPETEIGSRIRYITPSYTELSKFFNLAIRPKLMEKLAQDKQNDEEMKVDGFEL